jgi:hypothetical protein
MNIHDAAKRLIELGIPGKNKKKAIKSALVKKDSIHVDKALRNYVEKMLVRWAYTEGVILKPEPHKDKNGVAEIGRGKMSDWSDTIVEEGAAVWAVRKKWREIHSGKKSRLSKDMIEVIKRAASVIDERPFAIYTLPPVTGPLTTQSLDPKDIEMKFVSEDCDGLALFPGADLTEKVDCLNKLVISWVAAIEKVRAWKSRGIMAQLELESGSEWETFIHTLTYKEIDFSQIDPWRVEVPCPWQIDKHARVTLIWWSADREFWQNPSPFQRTLLSESDHDDLFLLENGIDTRVFFKIDVTDSARWAKAKVKETEGIMRSSTSAAEQLALSLYREQLKNVFHV